MGSKVTALSAFLALLFCGACSADPEVVATALPGSGLPFAEKGKCTEGVYKGNFFTWPTDAGRLSLSGTIEFALVESRQGGEEFLQLGPNTKLEGKDLEARVYFIADVRTQRCVAGAYNTVLENGKFSGLDENDNPVEQFVPFTGTISGSYTQSTRTFAGQWETSVGSSSSSSSSPASPALTGGWVAILGSQ